jgi:hypothetical protein
MAQPTTIKGSKVTIQLEGPIGTWTAPCALSTKGIDFSADANEQNVPDCANPDLPTFTARVISTLSAAVSGAGILAMESLDEWRLWFDSGLEKNIRFKLDAPSAVNGGYYQMSAVLTAFSIGANIGELATVDVGIQSNGAWTWTPAVP